MINATKCVVKSKRKPPVSSFRVSVLSFLVGFGVTVLLSLRSRDRRTLYDAYFLYSSPQVILKFRRSREGKFREVFSRRHASN